MKLAITKKNIRTLAFERNTMRAEGSGCMAFVQDTYEATVVIKAGSLNDGGQITDHAYIKSLMLDVMGAFDRTMIAWSEDPEAYNHVRTTDDQFNVRYLISPYNPTQENLTGMMFALVKRVLECVSFCNSESGDLSLHAVALKSDDGTAVYFDWRDFTNNFYNAGQFQWSSLLLEDYEGVLPLGKLFTEEVSLHVPKLNITVNPYE